MIKYCTVDSIDILVDLYLLITILDGKISKRCDWLLYNIVNQLFTGTTDDVL